MKNGNHKDHSIQRHDNHKAMEMDFIPATIRESDYPPKEKIAQVTFLSFSSFASVTIHLFDKKAGKQY